MPLLKNKYHMYHTHHVCHNISHNIRVTAQVFFKTFYSFCIHSRGLRKGRNKINKKWHVREKLTYQKASCR